MSRTKISLQYALWLATPIVAACSQGPGAPTEPSGSSSGSGSVSSSGSGSSAGKSSGASTGTASGTSSGAMTGSASGQSRSGTTSGSSGMDDASLDGPSQETNDGGADDPATPPDCITPTTAQSCAPPVNTALPICQLSLTGCMDPTTPTKVNSKAVYYEVNSPLWSDNAAKTRAFILPANGKIHVKDCNADAGDAALSADCVSPMGTAQGPADTGKWVFPVGTVMIKNFMFDGKLVETRLLMHVDDATASLIQSTEGYPPGTDWVGYNYAWNEAQTEATIVPNSRTAVSFNTGTRTVAWNYPSFQDCITCHTPATGTLGPETAQMNRTVNGQNQIDAFKAAGYFDNTAPTKPYTTAFVEPYMNTALGLTHPTAGATVDQMARSYLSANCGFCHRPDVNDQGFDLRGALSLYDTHICNLTMEQGIPSMPNVTYVDFDPGNHAQSAMWIRMNIQVPSTDPDEMFDVGRMPPLASFVVDQQAADLVAQWIDSIKSCPTSADAGL
jgi:cytochrome c551/c552